MDASADQNRARITQMTALFHISCLLLTIEIMAWVVGRYGAPPMPWGRWLLGLIGFPVRHPLAPKRPKR
jgi:hypothetical protein